MPKYLENVQDKNSGTSFSTEIAEINHWYNDDTETPPPQLVTKWPEMTNLWTVKEKSCANVFAFKFWKTCTDDILETPLRPRFKLVIVFLDSNKAVWLLFLYFYKIGNWKTD